jgi:hypothetical protein
MPARRCRQPVRAVGGCVGAPHCDPNDAARRDEQGSCHGSDRVIAFRVSSDRIVPSADPLTSLMADSCCRARSPYSAVRLERHPQHRRGAICVTGGLFARRSIRVGSRPMARSIASTTAPRHTRAEECSRGRDVARRARAGGRCARHEYRTDNPDRSASNCVIGRPLNYVELCISGRIESGTTIAHLCLSARAGAAVPHSRHH